jgi:hypothetical protein
MEYIEGCDWEDGVSEATDRETGWMQLDGSLDPKRRGGILLLKDIFGERFAGFRGAGGWSPQLMEVLRQNGLSVHHTLFDMGEATGYSTAFYLGCLQVSPGRTKWTGQFPFASPLTNRLECELILTDPNQGIGRFAESFQRMVANYPFRGPRFLFVNFHPFFLFTDTVADILNYSNGRMPFPPDQIVRSILLSHAEMERRRQMAEKIFDWLCKIPDVSFVTSIDFVEQSRRPAPELSSEEIVGLAKEVAQLPLMRPPAYIDFDERLFSLAEAFDLLQQTATYFNQCGDLPIHLHPRYRLGPREIPDKETERVVCPTAGEVLQAASALPDGAIPAQVPLPDGPVAPYPFLVALGRALLFRDQPGQTVLVRPTDFDFPEMAESFNLSLVRNADWEIYHRYLDPSKIIKQASLQLWTYRPVEAFV